MDYEALMNRFLELEREIAILPEGGIAKKNIKGRDYYYHRTSKDGKRTENYIEFTELNRLSSLIEKKKEFKKELKIVKKQLEILQRAENKVNKKTHKDADKKVKDKANTNSNNENNKTLREDSFKYRTAVRYGSKLEAQVNLTRRYKKRECFKGLRDYIFGEQQEKVFIIYGLRRTGKTTMIRQILAELPEDEFKKAAFIQVTTRDSLADLDSDIRKLEENGFKYVFIDEITLLDDFVEGAAIFADIYACSGMKIVLSGTDSLGFAFSKEEQLYDRCIMMHTTFIPYREFEEVLGIEGIDEYIRYGGTMSLGGFNYNLDAPFSNSRTAEDYIDTAIARNIQHSLKMYKYGGHFRQLLDLYECGELTNVINRVVENINHSFTRSVVERTFKSHDLAMTAANMLRDKEKSINIKEHLNLDTVTFGVMQVLDILNKEEQSVDIEDSHMIQIREYLLLLDMIVEIDLVSLPEVSRKGKLTVISQPGLRYAQADAIVENMLLDAKFQELSVKERQRVLERLLSEIRGRMMEEIVLLETKIAKPESQVFKLQFAIGEFDMVVFNPRELTCEIYEIKYSTEQVPEQYRHIIDEKKCDMTSHRYGDITGRYVIYRGASEVVDGIQYLNVEEYLKGLYQS